MKERRQKKVGVGDAFLIRRAKETKAASEGSGGARVTQQRGGCGSCR